MDESYDLAIIGAGSTGLTAAAEMARVLRPGGRLGLTDMTVDGPLPEDVQSLLAWVACVAGAGTLEDYVATLRAAGFSDFTVEDQRGALLDVVADVRRKLLGLELAAGLGKLGGSIEPSRRGLAELLGDLDLSEGKRLVHRVVDLIESGVVGYTLIAART